MTTEPTAPSLDVDPFDRAEFYDCYGSETLTYITPEEAVEAWLDSWMIPGCDAVAIIRDHSPIAVTAYSRETVTEQWVKGLAESLLERIGEDFCEDYGDPNGNGGEIDDADLNAELPAMTELVLRACSNAEVWQCEAVASRNYGAEEAEAMMREYNSGWFEKSDPSSVAPVDDAKAAE